MPIIRLTSAAFAVLAFSAAASAQETKPADPVAGVGLTSINMSHSVVLPLADGDDPFARQSEAMRSFYDLVGASCATVLERIGDSCEIISITFNSRSGNEGARPNREPARETVRIDGQVRMLVRLKANVGPPSARNSERRQGVNGQL